MGRGIGPLRTAGPIEATFGVGVGIGVGIGIATGAELNSILRFMG